MKLDGSLAHSQAYTPCPYPEPDQSGPCLPMPNPEDLLQYCAPLLLKIQLDATVCRYLFTAK